MKTTQKLFENFHKNKSLLALQVTSFFLSNKMAITRSFFIRSRRAIRQNLRIERTDQMVKFLGHKTILKGRKYPCPFRPESKNKGSSNIFSLHNHGIDHLVPKIIYLNNKYFSKQNYFSHIHFSKSLDTIH